MNARAYNTHPQRDVKNGGFSSDTIFISMDLYNRNFSDNEEILENGPWSTIRQKIIHINIPALWCNKSACLS
jgi:hypothetical protein